MMQDDTALLAQCRILIEKKIGWGESRQWTSADFEALSEKIFAETGVSLSTSTLKRLWGRVKYASSPQVATLNALARFAGYDDYREFVAHCGKEEKAEKDKPAREIKPPDADRAQEKTLFQKSPLSKSAIWSVGVLMGIVISLFLAFSLRQKPDERKGTTAQYSFSSRPVAAGIPNSVVFTFDVSQAKTDCLFVQQSWDESKRFMIERNQHEATSIYYYPGFYKAKLTVDSTVVQQHKLLIKTDGWLPLIAQEPIPIYFKSEESTRNGAFGLSIEQIERRNIPMQPEVPNVQYFYVQDFGTLSSNNFTLETSVKNTFSIGSGACQKTQVVVLCENSMFVVPLSIPGCTSAIDAYLPGKPVRGNKTDLSKFGVDFSDWARLRLSVKNKAVTVFLNEKPVLKTAFTFNAGRVIGVGYSFEGTGLVDYARLLDGEGKMVLREEF